MHAARQTGETKANAEGWLGLERQKIVLGEFGRPEPSTPRTAEATFTDYATAWVTTRELRPKTREGYEHVLNKYLVPRFTSRPIADITPADVRTWWASMNPDTPTVGARSYALLKAVLNTAVADDLIDANPCRIRGASNSPQARDVRPASVDELSAIAEAMPVQYRALVLLGAWCALRSGELLELRRRDVDVVHGTVRVERGLLGSGQGGHRHPEVGGWHPHGRHRSAHRSCGDPPPGPVHRVCRQRPPVPRRQRRLEPPAVDAVQVLAAGAGGSRSTGPPPPRPAPHRRDDGR